MKKELKRNFLVVWALVSAGVLVFAADTTPTITGAWEGESKCTVAGSPCHDEHVVYEIKQISQGTDHYAVDAYKIVSGERDFMGTLDCRYPAENNTLRCIGRHPDDVWSFTISSDQMTGTLTIGTGRQLYRRVQVKRSKGQ